MELEQNYMIYKTGDFQEKWNAYISLLYKPLIENDACMLYDLFLSLDQTNITLEKLLMLYGSYANRFDASKKKLENYELIKTYYDPISRKNIIEVYPPLNAESFLNHDTFSRLFLNQCGSSHFDFVKLHFNDEIDKTNYVDISEKMDLSCLESWTQEKEETYLNLKPEEGKLKYDFDFETFLKGADRIFPMRYRTKENLSRIASLASIHGIDAVDMRKYVQRSINPNTHVFDFEKLKKQVYANQKIIKPTDDPYKMSPVKFLQNKQQGAPVANADRKVIEKLIKNYSFSNEVMNVLIEYCLNQTQQKFSKAYVEKVAASWIRLQVDSKEKALEVCRQENQVKKTSPKLPDWYQNTEQSVPDDDLVQQALSLQRQLGKEKNDEI